MKERTLKAVTTFTLALGVKSFKLDLRVTLRAESATAKYVLVEHKDDNGNIYTIPAETTDYKKIVNVWELFDSLIKEKKCIEL